MAPGHMAVRYCIAVHQADCKCAALFLSLECTAQLHAVQSAVSCLAPILRSVRLNICVQTPRRYSALHLALTKRCDLDELECLGVKLFSAIHSPQAKSECQGLRSLTCKSHEAPAPSGGRRLCHTVKCIQ